ncbi:hypothetical protein AMATHDRAFT_141784 [Amanita thiersii Skay4041]|uniref:DUF202 domain-containing protein n=1 Tax=Amanita thiersii Skay4041 TaxID=703135 RepID=A0A2A9NVM0_9AGAR|nr:hypothetical protein AMATHDRAFT_141784 [Amanita thiersii Skay4041]
MATAHLVRNEGSAARDFCMLERNLLSHMKLALLLSLLSSSFLLRTRLFIDEPQNAEDDLNYEIYGLPLSIVQYAAAVITVIGGVWEFYNGHRDFRLARAFLSAPKIHLVMMGVVSAIIFGTCVTLLAAD